MCVYVFLGHVCALCVRLATKRARVKVLVLVYELNVKVTYFKPLAKNNGKLCKKQGDAGEKCDTHTHYLIFTALGRNKKSAKVKSRIAPKMGWEAACEGGVASTIYNV